MRKSKHQYYVFSVFSSVIGNYPYYPFIGKTVTDGLQKYMKFLRNRESICEGAELHLIGTCELYPDSTELENLQPYIIPKRVEIKNNRFSRLLVLGTFYLQSFERYLKTLKERINYGKEKN